MRHSRCLFHTPHSDSNANQPSHPLHSHFVMQSKKGTADQARYYPPADPKSPHSICGTLPIPCAQSEPRSNTAPVQFPIHISSSTHSSSASFVIPYIHVKFSGAHQIPAKSAHQVCGEVAISVGEVEVPINIIYVGVVEIPINMIFVVQFQDPNKKTIYIKATSPLSLAFGPSICSLILYEASPMLLVKKYFCFFIAFQL